MGHFNYWFFSIIFIVLIAATMLIFSDPEGETIYEKVSDAILKEEIPINEGLETSNNPGIPGIPGSSGSSSGGGGGSGIPGAPSYTIPPSCSIEQISYSLQDFQEDIECLASGPSGCTNLQANCSMNAINLDPATSIGDFLVRYALIDISTENELDFNLIQKHINSGGSDVFEATFSITNSSGIDENVKCSFRTTIPKKEICS